MVRVRKSVSKVLTLKYSDSQGECGRMHRARSGCDTCHEARLEIIANIKLYLCCKYVVNVVRAGL